MRTDLILWPVFALVLLTAGVAIRLFTVSVMASKNRELPKGYFRTYQGDAPEALLAARDHYKNLFEMPVHFYLLMALIYASGNVYLIDIVLAWAYVSFRYVHSFIRATTNRVSYRYKVFVVSFVILLFEWAVFSWRLWG